MVECHILIYALRILYNYYARNLLNKKIQTYISFINTAGEISLKIAVIGGTRGLGKWIARFLKNRNFNVIITGRDKITGNKVSKKLGVEYTSSNEEAVSSADIVISVSYTHLRAHET